jgi:hypothetical protein
LRVLSGGQPHRAGEWADTVERSLEDQLTEITPEISLRGAVTEHRHLAEIEAAHHKRIRWEAAAKEAASSTPRPSASGTSKHRKRHGVTPPDRPST